MFQILMMLMIVAVLSLMMVTVSDTRYFEMTTLDTPVTNKALGGTTLSPYIVPPGMTHIVAFNVQYSAPGSTTGSSGAIAKLSGDGLAGVRTPVELPMGAFGATLATTHSTPARAGHIPTNMPVVEGAEIDATSTLVGVDTGDCSSSLEIVYSSEPNPDMPIMTTYKTLEAIVAAVDTPTRLEDAGSAKDFKPGKKDIRIKQLITAVVGDSADVGAANTAVRFTGNGIDQDQVFTLDGSGGTHATEGNGHAEARVRNINAKVDGIQPIRPEAIVSGADTGNTIFLVGIGLSETG